MDAAAINDFQPRAQAALAASPFYELRDLSVKRCQDALLISGRVSSFYYKQLAQEVVRSVCSGIPLINSTEVRPEED